MFKKLGIKFWGGVEGEGHRDSRKKIAEIGEQGTSLRGTDEEGGMNTDNGKAREGKTKWTALRGGSERKKFKLGSHWPPKGYTKAKN